MQTQGKTRSRAAGTRTYEWLSRSELAITAQERTTVYVAPGADQDPAMWRVRMDPGFEGVLNALGVPCPRTLTLIDVVRLVPDVVARHRVLDAHRTALRAAQEVVRRNIAQGPHTSEEHRAVYGPVWHLEQQWAEALQAIEAHGWATAATSSGGNASS